MKTNKLTSGLGSIVFALFLFVPLTGAYAACCSGHGGVASCNKTTGFKVCKDGTASPSCTCPKAKATKKATTSKSKAVKTTTTTTTVPSKSTKTTPTKKSDSNWLWGSSKTKSTTTTTKGVTTTNGKSHKGCCSRHGGVAQCDTRSNKLKCKDNTISSTCTCH